MNPRSTMMLQAIRDCSSFNQGIIMQRNKTYPDNRVYLKIKLLSLMAEARIIRRVEHKHRDISQLNHMHVHRTLHVRREARHTHLAYGFIRGKAWGDMEHNWKDQVPYPNAKRGSAGWQPDWKYIQRLIDKYGPKDQPYQLYDTDKGWMLAAVKEAEPVPA